MRHTEKLRERNKENIEKCKQLKADILLFTVIFPPPPFFYIIDKKKLKFWEKNWKKISSPEINSNIHGKLIFGKIIKAIQ